jgi:hypothetical protein
MSTTDRQLEADSAIERALLRDKPDLTDSALGYLRDEARKTIEYRDYQTGMALDVSAVVRSIKLTDVGTLIYADGQEADAAPVDHAQAIEGMNSQQRMNYARAHSLQ